MNFEVYFGIMLPFLGTVVGASLVFFMKGTLKRGVQRAFSGFAAGVMVAASVWSLLLPAIEAAAPMGFWAFVPAVVGFWLGVLFLLALDHLVPHLNRSHCESEGLRSHLGKRTKMVLAVTLHNIPEGMAVGAAYAACLLGDGEPRTLGAFVLALGIAIQNLPEGAIISMPLRAEGVRRGRSFWDGVLSGAVEPLFAILTVLLSGLIVPLLPYFLSFAAGAMLYVVVEELIADAVSGDDGDTGTVFFALGFSLMMLLDVALG